MIRSPMNLYGVAWVTCWVWLAAPVWADDCRQFSGFGAYTCYKENIAQAEGQHGQHSLELIEPLSRFAFFMRGEKPLRVELFGRIVDILDRNPDHGTIRLRIDALYDYASALVIARRHADAQSVVERAFKLRDALPRQSLPPEPGKHFHRLFQRMDGDEPEGALLAAKRLLAELEVLEQPGHVALADMWEMLKTHFYLSDDIERARIAASYRLEALAQSSKTREVDFKREAEWIASSFWEKGKDFDGADAFRKKAAGLWLARAQPAPTPATGEDGLNALAGQFEKARREGRSADLAKVTTEILALLRAESTPASQTAEALAQRLSSHYLGLGDPVNAMLAGERAMALADQLRGKDHPDNADSYQAVALVYGNLGNFKAMAGLYERIHANYLAHQGKPKYARLARNMASELPGLWLQAGDHARARRHYEDTLFQVDAQDNLELRMGHRTHIASIAIEEGRLDLAIHYSIQAVNLLQVMRSRIKGLDGDMQRSFVQAHDYIYKQLANWLMDAERQAEALQVLRLMEQEEDFEFLGVDPSGRQIEISEAERRVQEKQADIGQRAARIGVELAELDALANKRALSPDEASRRTALLADQMTWKLAYERNLADLERLIDMQSDKRKREIGEHNLRMLAPLQATLKQLGPGTVLVHYVVLEHEIKVLLTTAQGSPIIRSSPMKQEDLKTRVDAFRRLLQQPRGSQALLASAQELHRLLIGPIENDLRQAGARTLMLAPDAGLRYLPFAALHDGQDFLVERYALAMYSEAARDRLRDRPQPDGTVAAFGLTRSLPGFDALPGVRQELAGIIGDRLLTGPVRLDNDFGADQLRAALGTKPSVLHLASHFAFRPGKEKDSFLVLGTGDRLSLADIKHLRFDGIDLVTLSACDTAFGGGQNANGREITGLATLVQENGAQAVMATLWKVADASTAKFMQHFYRLRQEQKLTKAEALRQAQLKLIRGSTRDDTSDATTPRAAGNIRIGGKPVVDTPEVDLGWAHPYYWAPFVLMGNWL
jgi:CHAT domain-containing protein